MLVSTLKHSVSILDALIRFSSHQIWSDLLLKDLVLNTVEQAWVFINCFTCMTSCRLAVVGKQSVWTLHNLNQHQWKISTLAQTSTHIHTNMNEHQTWKIHHIENSRMAKSKTLFSSLPCSTCTAELPESSPAKHECQYLISGCSKQSQIEN